MSRRILTADGTLVLSLTPGQVEILRRGWGGRDAKSLRSIDLLTASGLLQRAPLGGLRATPAGTAAVRLYDVLAASVNAAVASEGAAAS